MTWLRLRWLPLTVLVAAVGLLVTSVAWVGGGAGWGPGGPLMGGPGMGPGMGRGVALAGTGAVDDLDDARRAADRFADRWGLVVGEVMEFDNGYYAELAHPSGRLATEVLVEPRSGTVQLEFGPAMMWNTEFDMHRGGGTDAAIGPEAAREIAGDWLAENRPGEQAAEPDVFPGYYTLHVLDDGEVVGMLSVHAVGGAVWYHSWHGDFVAMTEDDD